jgi:hypothetical protein
MGWISLSPEAWLGVALLLMIVTAIILALLGQKPVARMDFFLRLLENLPNDDVPVPRTGATGVVRPR